MIFNLFKSRKSKWKKRLIKGFDIYIPGVQGLNSETIGAMLDKAQFIKNLQLCSLKKTIQAEHIGKTQ